jgi:hypothetical protein
VNSFLFAGSANLSRLQFGAAPRTTFHAVIVTLPE